MKTSILVALLPIASAHFLLDSPPSRGFDDAKIGTFPCGGFDTVQSTRAAFPISNGQIALTMADPTADIEVLIGVGNTVGNGFNTVIRQTFAQTGLGAFCMTGFELPAAMAGMNATIQIVARNEDAAGGGLYNCADVTLSAAAVKSAVACTNATGVTTGASTITGNPNVTASKPARSVAGARVVTLYI